MHKAHWRGDDAGRMGLALADEVTQFHQCRRCIAEGEECIGMLLNGEADARLSACDALCRGHLGNPRVAQIALGFQAQSCQCPLADAAGHHRHIGYNGL